MGNLVICCLNRVINKKNKYRKSLAVQLRSSYLWRLQTAMLLSVAHLISLFFDPEDEKIGVIVWIIWAEWTTYSHLNDLVISGRSILKPEWRTGMLASFLHFPWFLTIDRHGNASTLKMGSESTPRSMHTHTHMYAHIYTSTHAGMRCTYISGTAGARVTGRSIWSFEVHQGNPLWILPSTSLAFSLPVATDPFHTSLIQPGLSWMGSTGQALLWGHAALTSTDVQPDPAGRSLPSMVWEQTKSQSTISVSLQIWLLGCTWF